MHRVVFLIALTIIIIISVQFINISESTSSARPEYVLVIHGGAGNNAHTIPDSLKQIFKASLMEALRIGEKILAAGGSSLDAVEAVIRFLEDDPKFNAGKGAVVNSEGFAELDAAIMDGSDLSCGAVAVVRTVKNPISLARLVMEKTNHVLLAGEGADKFGDSMKVEKRPPEYFFDKKRYEEWKKSQEDFLKDKKGTVGAVALDKKGNLAAGTSTGGRGGKLPGRVGDAPLINAGTYANNKTCAVSCTGIGEEFIRHTVAYNMSAFMEFRGFTLQQAADEILFKRLKPGDGGLIAVDTKGNYVLSFNTKGMFRGVVTSTEKAKVAIGPNE